MMDVLHAASLETDMVLTSGGVSVGGDADYIKLALDKLGEINFLAYQHASRPPFVYGKLKTNLLRFTWQPSSRDGVVH
ncbi:hypothetical protein O9992_18950 [Vibrio lentus]|nr:hypothetical protein [Vibrio lentus]